MIRMLNRKWTRISILLSIVVVVGLSLAQKISSYESTDGVVNAHVVTLKTPIEGKATINSAVLPGRTVQQGEILGKIDNVLIDYSFLMELRTERNFLLERTYSLAQAISDLQAIKQELDENLANFRDSQKKVLLTQTSSIDSEIESIKAEIQFEQSRYNRYSRIINRGSVSAQDLEEAQSRILSLGHTKRSLQQQRNTKTVRLEALETNTFVNESNNDLPYLGQVIYQLRIRTVEKQQLLAETKERINQINDQIVIEAGQKLKEQQYEIVSPVNGIVWRRHVHPNAMVAIDAELFKIADCNSVFLEAQVAERLFDRIRLGQEVSFRFRNSNTQHSGTVRSKHGVRTIHPDTEIAALVENNDNRRNRVVIQPSDLNKVADKRNMCNLGRRVVVTFPR